MERGVIDKAKFIHKDHKIQLDKLYIKFTPVDSRDKTGLVKTSFRIYLDDNFIGYAPLDMMAIIPETKIINPKLQVILKIADSPNINNVPFLHEMKITQFLGKIFKQDKMIETAKGDNIVVISRSNLKRRKKK